jgi:putative transposase
MSNGSCDRHYPTGFDQINELTGLRAELPWLADVPRNVCAELLRTLDKAWQRCFKRVAKAPHWKRKDRDTTALCEPSPKAWHLISSSIQFPKLGAKIHRHVEGTPKTCAIIRDVDQWYACIVCEVSIIDPIPSNNLVVAVDRGVINFAADSDGNITKNPRHLLHTAKHLARAQRVVSRRCKNSKNKAKAKLRVARLHRKVRRQRLEFVHQLSYCYANSHSCVVLEKLNIEGMVKNHRLARSILDAGWGIFASQLRYKMLWLGGSVEQEWAAYSSQTCAICGVVDANSRHGESFCCTSCGHVDHADVNAAKVILSRRNYGKAACGGSAEVRRPKKQEKGIVRSFQSLVL